MQKCVIIEDEKPAARYLKSLVENENIEVVALLHSVEESIFWFKENSEPDLIFLDIQLGDGKSFEIFEKVQIKSSIIFTTAFSEFAIKAFKLNSIDYVLKPINKKDIKAAIEKYFQLKTPFNIDISQIQQLLQTNFENRYKERFLIKIGSNLRSISSKDIACFYSKDKTTYLFTEGREYPLDISISDLIQDLQPKDFFQISRSVIVQLAFIDTLVAYSGNRFMVKIKQVHEELIVSRERVQEFKNWLSC